MLFGGVSSIACLAMFHVPADGRPLHLIMLHGPGGQIIEINADEISSIRIPVISKEKGGYHHQSVRCIITMTNGNFNAVTETCEQVDTILGNSEGKEK